MEGLGRVKVISGDAGAGSIVRVVPESSLGVAINTSRRSDGSIKTSVGRAAGNTASSVGIISLKVLLQHNIGEHVLIDSLASHVGDSDNNIGNCGVDVDSLEDLVDSVEGLGFHGVPEDGFGSSYGGSGCGERTSCVGVLIDDESVDCNLDVVIGCVDHTDS